MALQQFVCVFTVAVILLCKGCHSQQLGPLYEIVGNTSSPSDDGSSPEIPLLQPFVYFGRSYNQIYVNNNGHLTFTAPWSSFSPQQFPINGLRDIIAVFWTDIYNVAHGDIYYAQFDSGQFLQQVTQDINTYFPEFDFTAKWIFLATWFEVAYYGDPEARSTFQAVLTTDGKYSFVLLNYGNLTPTSRAIEAGYDTIRSTDYFTLPGSFTNNAAGNKSIFSYFSNVNVTGRWAFRVDKSSTTGETWPWLALIKYSGSTFCQGSLITDQWVLTAARCSLNNYLSGAVVHLGVYTLSDLNEVTRRVEYFICHQDFNLQTSENDICVVKLSASVNFTDYIQPVSLAAENSTFYDGTPSQIITVGYSYYNQPVFPQEIDVSVVGQNSCNCSLKSYYNYFSNRPTENQLCASQNASSYYGNIGADTGAALVTKQNSTWVQSGILSVNFGNWQQVTVYTRVSQYQKWISDRVSGIKPGFVTFTSPGNDSDLDYTCPTPTTTTPYTFVTSNFSSETTTPRYPFVTSDLSFETTTPETTIPTTNEDRVFTDDSIWNKGGNLIPITHFISLSVLVLFLHVFVGCGGF